MNLIQIILAEGKANIPITDVTESFSLNLSIPLGALKVKPSL
jgi:hypothetical protein